MLNPTPLTRAYTLDGSLLNVLMRITETSTHGHEMTMHRLLLDLGDLYALGHLRDGEYACITGAAMDVLFYFNYDPESLAQETDRWYRAAVVHQMGQAMLQTVALERPEYMAKTFYREAMAGFSLTRSSTAAPVHCRQWPYILQASA